MKIFLSARYSKRDELRAIRNALAAEGYTICSRWLDTEWELNTNNRSSAAPPEYREKWAESDLEDVTSCDVFVAFTEESRSNSRGGRHVELGAALILKKRIIVVGPLENIFHHHPDVSTILDRPEDYSPPGYPVQAWVDYFIRCGLKGMGPNYVPDRV